MKTKWIFLLVLLLAAVLVFGACKKKPSNSQPAGGDPGSQSPASSGENDPSLDGLRFLDMPNGNVFSVSVEGQSYSGEELVIPFYSPDEKIVVKIADLGFSPNINLKKVVLPGSIETIGGHAFLNCTSLASVELPSSLEKIKSGAFEGCTSLTEINYSGSMNSWKNIEIADDWIDAGKTIIIHCNDGDVAATGPQIQSE